MSAFRRSMLGLATASLALVASACAGSSGRGSTEVPLTLRDYQMNLSRTTIPPGSITFVATNAGPSVHEVEVLSVPSGVDPNTLEVNDNVAGTKAKGLASIDEVEDIVPSTTANLTVTLKPGRYVLICNLPGHYGRGMHVAFTIQ